MIHPVETGKETMQLILNLSFKCPFSVFFQDTNTRILALPTFSEMIRKKYEQKEIDFILSEAQVPFRNEAPNTLVNGESGAKLVIIAPYEIFSHRKPILITVDPVSSAILRIELADSLKTGV